MKRICSFSIWWILLISTAGASEKFSPLFNLTAGMMSINFTQNESTLEEEENPVNIQIPESGVASLIGMKASFEYFPAKLYSYLGEVMVPMFSSDGSVFYRFSLAVNYYFNSIGSRMSVADDNGKMMASSPFRYYAGLKLGGGFIVYNTTYAKQSDVLFEMGGHVGFYYDLYPDFAFHGEIGLGKGTGVTISTMGTYIFTGISVYLDRFGF